MLKAMLTKVLPVMLILAVVPLYGQGAGKGPGGPPLTPPGQGPVQPPDAAGPPPTATPTPNKVVETFTGGRIEDVLAEYGAAYPVIVFSHSSLTAPIEVRLAPIWYLEQALNLDLEALNTFEGKTADLVVFYRLNVDDVVYHAITLTVDDVEYRFRTDDGKPLWTPSGKIKERKAADAALLAGSARDLGGTVLRIAPSLVSGELVLTMVGDDCLRYRIRLAAAEELMATDFGLREGNRIRLRFALEQQTGGAVALQLTTESQWTLRLRDENGRRVDPD